MTPDDLGKVIAQTGHERYRWLTSDANPDAKQREAYRRLVERQALGEPEYPPLAKQVANALGSAAKFAASGLATVDQAEYERRRAICTQPCPTERYVAAEDRCEACGCHLSIKPWGKAEKCPEGHW